MQRFHQYILAGLSILLGCKSANDNKPSDTRASSSWTYVIINANSKEFLVSTYDDTLTFKKTLADKIISPQKVKISKSEKDSLFKWTERLIQTKPEPTNYCTDYYGKLTLRIVYSEQVSRQVEYSSICEWQSLDSNTSHIYNLMHEKVSDE